MTDARAQLLRGSELVERDGIYHRRDDGDATAYRQRWEDEAAEDHVRSAIATGKTTELDFAALTSKIAPVWDRIPRDRDLGRVLEIGAGYGRIPLYLAANRGVTWSEYYANDISEGMLRRLIGYRERLTPSAAPLFPICVSADDLPLEDDSIDTALTSAVFLHMGKSFVRSAVAEIARVLKPGGSVVFDSSFPNARNPANLVLQAKPKRLRSPNYLKFWTRGEIDALLESTGLTAKTGPLEVVASSYELVPRRLGPVPVPLARRVNRAVGDRPRALHPVSTLLYGVFSPRLGS